MTEVGRVRPLEGVTICMVYYSSLRYSTRLRQEASALVAAGASVCLVSTHPGDPFAPANVSVKHIPRTDTGHWIPASQCPYRVFRIASNLVRNAIRCLAEGVYEYRHSRNVRDALTESQADVYWVVDVINLTAAVNAKRRTSAALVYETLDLVPEYLHHGWCKRQRRLRAEKRSIDHLDGFITAAEGYADYYVAKYGLARRGCRPLVRHDSPAHIAHAVSPIHRPLRCLFLGNLTYERELDLVLGGVAASDANVRLTLQGEDRLGGSLAQLIKDLKLEDAVTIAEPCPPEDIVAAASKFDIGIVSLEPASLNERLASSTKLFTYMAAGLAVIGSDLPGIRRIVSRHQNGLLVGTPSVEGWADAFSAVAIRPDAAIRDMKERSLQAARLYSWEAEHGDFIAVFVESTLNAKERATAKRTPSPARRGRR